MLEEAGVVSFFAAGGVSNLELWDGFTWLVRVWPDIETTAAKRTSAGESFRVTMHHKVEPWRVKR